MSDLFDRTVIFGAGDVGCLLGICIGCDNSVVYLGRDSSIGREQRAATADRGLTVKHPFAKWKLHTPAEVCREVFTTDQACLSEASLILVCTKRGANSAVAKALSEHLPRAGRKPPVVMMQNGIGAAKEMAELLGDKVECFGGISEGCISLNVVRDLASNDASTILWTSPMGQSQVCFDRESAHGQQIADRLSAAGLPCVASDDMNDVMAGKLIMNMWNSVNAISGGMLMHEFMMQPGYRRVVVAAQRELIEVFDAASVKYCTANHEKDGLLTMIPKVLLLPSWVLKLILGGVMKSRDARTSMGEDVVLGRDETEVEYLNGVAVRLGGEHGVPTPVNLQLLELVRSRRTLPPDELVMHMEANMEGDLPPIKCTLSSGKQLRKTVAITSSTTE
jgi:2-dehydropantoate 2-reductase